ncbi:MAG: DCC1-like thiol-disulfide oxidoreductase family protein [Bacteroidota bacterium]
MADYTFLYDDVCPLCQAYTAGFARLQWSDRKPFSQVDHRSCDNLDLDRGRHEIPLLDAETGEVHYGLDAMTTVLGQGLPFLRPLFRHPYFLAALKPLYWLITYNRRVIAGTKPPATGFDCAPDFHRAWRLAYVGIMVLVISLLGWPPVLLTAGMVVLLVVGGVLHGNYLVFAGHWVTLVFVAALISALIPGILGLGLAYAWLAWELWRRF